MSLASSSVQLQESVKRYSVAGSYYATSGSADAIVLSVKGGYAPVTGSYIDGMKCRFKALATNTGVATVNVSSLGAVTIKKDAWTTNLVAGDITINKLYEITYDSTSGFFNLVQFELNDATTTVKGIVELATDAETQTGTDTTRAVTPAGLASLNAGVPVGTILDYAGSLQTNYLLCNGASVSTTTYATLFAKIGYTFGGSGANFNLPKGDIYYRGTGASALGVELAAQNASHTHYVAADVNEGTTLTSSNQVARSRDGIGDDLQRYHLTASSTAATVGRTSSNGGSELRPNTLIVTKMIKYQ